MIILGLDCSSKQSSVCICDGDKILYTCVQATNTTHSQNLMPMVKNALDVCGLTVKQVDLFAPCIGPGSFTGLRIGLAAVKGMARANNTRCIGVSSLKALAKSVDFDGIIVPVFDARHNQVYRAVMDGENVIREDFCADVSALKPYIENAEKNVYFVGDGKALCYKTYGDIPAVKPNKTDMPCIAMGACLLAKEEFDKNGGKTHFDLSPSYLRLSQAEREMKEKTEGLKK